MHNEYEVKNSLKTLKIYMPGAWCKKAKLYKCTPCPEKKIPNIVNRHSKKCLPILIIFGTNISGATSHQMTRQL